MLFLIFVIILAAGIIWAILDKHEDFFGGWVSTIIVGAMTVIVSIVIMAVSYISVDGYVAQMNTRHKMLVYQYENNVYENDNDLGKRELITDIQSWNEDLARKREIQDNFWIGIYTPNIYDQFEFIELDKSK